MADVREVLFITVSTLIVAEDEVEPKRLPSRAVKGRVSSSLITILGLSRRKRIDFPKCKDFIKRMENSNVILNC